MTAAKRVELGCAGHFVASDSCRFRRHTQIATEHGGYRVSTVGDLYFQHEKPKKRMTLGCDDDSFFETYVFRLGTKPTAGSENCGCIEVVDWSEIDGIRTATAGEAQAMHEKMVAKYLAEAKADQ